MYGTILSKKNARWAHVAKGMKFFTPGEFKERALMPRTILDRELQALHKQLLGIGSHITTALQQLLLVLETGNQEVASAIIILEKTIDDLLTEAEGRTLRLLILQQPLGGRTYGF